MRRSQAHRRNHQGGFASRLASFHRSTMSPTAALRVAPESLPHPTPRASTLRTVELERRAQRALRAREPSRSKSVPDKFRLMLRTSRPTRKEGVGITPNTPAPPQSMPVLSPSPTRRTPHRRGVSEPSPLSTMPHRPAGAPSRRPGRGGRQRHCDLGRQAGGGPGAHCAFSAMARRSASSGASICAANLAPDAVPGVVSNRLDTNDAHAITHCGERPPRRKRARPGLVAPNRAPVPRGWCQSIARLVIPGAERRSPARP